MQSSMEKLLQSFLEKQFDASFASKVQFSAVPKGQMGDLALNFFALTKDLGQSPVQIAQEVQTKLESCDCIEKMVIVGPYLNVFFKSDIFFEQVFQASLVSHALDGKNMVIEFSGPNTNKPLHLGHMRNHALGIAVSNLLESAGADVHRVNIINDRGVHICKSMLAYLKFGNGETPESVGKKSDHFIGDWYVRFNEESKKDESLNDEVQKMLVAWEEGDTSVRELWKTMNGWTLSGHQQTYDRQGVQFEKVYLESETYVDGKKIAEEGLKKGVFKKREDGAIVIDLSDDGLDEKVVLRSDGTSIYLTQDLAVAVRRDKDFHHPDEMIYTVGDEQNYHFQVLFLCLDKLGILNKDRLTHLGYGMVNLPDGRMKSREGTVVDADNLMDSLSDMALEKVQERNSELSEDEARLIAEQIMNGAWKFYLLSAGPRKSITFNAEESLAFEGATGPYLQYAGVRIKSVLRKARESGIEPGFKGIQNLGSQFGKQEKSLGVKILEFENVLTKAASHKNPTYVVTYLLELSQTWSSYYAENSILNAETDELKKARLALAQKVLSVLEAGLKVLGIEVPERM